MDSVQKNNSNELGPKIQLKWTRSKKITQMDSVQKIQLKWTRSKNTTQMDSAHPGKSVIAQRWRRSLFSAATVRRQPSSCHQLAFHIKYETNTNTRIQKYEIQTQRSQFSPAKVSRQPSSYHELLMSFAFYIKYRYRYKCK